MAKKKIEVLLLLSFIFFGLALAVGAYVQVYLVNTRKIYGLFPYGTTDWLWLTRGILCPQLYWLPLLLYYLARLRIRLAKKTRDFGTILTFIYFLVLAILSSYFYIQFILVLIVINFLIGFFTRHRISKVN